MQRMVRNIRVCGIDKSIQIPVRMSSQHNRCRPINRYRDYPRRQRGTFRCRRHREGRVVNDSAGIPLEVVVLQHEGDARLVVGHNGPVALVVTNFPAVEGVVSVILVLGDMRGHAVECEGAILHPASVSPDCG